MNVKLPKIAVAGRRNMGGFLLNRLEKEHFPVEFSFDRHGIFYGKDEYPSFGTRPIKTTDDVAQVLDHFVNEAKVEMMFLAIPSGPHELPLIEYCIKKNIYVILFCKEALARHYAELQPHRHMIGANATVGGRTMSLPWLREQHLDRKKFTVYAIWNASTNQWMYEIVHHNDSASGSFDTVGRLGLAEPGSTDYIAFLNEELGGDCVKKVCIAMNDSMLKRGPFITPDDIRYKPFKNEHDVELVTLPTKSLGYILRIDNWGMPEEFDTQKPGGLFGQFKGFTVAGGFCDLSGNDAIARWAKGGRTNGVQIRFRGEHDFEGMIEMSGLGAGKATVGAAMNDLYQYLEARDGGLVEARWPERLARVA